METLPRQYREFPYILHPDDQLTSYLSVVHGSQRENNTNASLLTTVCTLFGLPQHFPHVLSLFWDSIQNSTFHVVVMSP